MTTDEDVLLREVDEDLQQDKQLDFLKKHGPWLVAAAAAAVIGVGVYQLMMSQRGAAAAADAEAYREAVLESDEAAGLTGADAMQQFGAKAEGGYKALAAFRAAGLFAAAGNSADALASFRTVYADGSAPTRLQDLARLRAASLLLDTDAAEAGEVADAVTTPSLTPYAKEIKALVAMAAEDFEVAHALLLDLSNGIYTPAPLAGRAAVLLPLADAGRAGVALVPQASEAEAFISSFTDQLAEEGLVPPQSSPSSTALTEGEVGSAPEETGAQEESGDDAVAPVE